MTAGRTEVIGVKTKKPEIVKIICDHHTFIGDLVENNKDIVVIKVDNIHITVYKDKIVALQTGFEHE